MKIYFNICVKKNQNSFSPHSSFKISVSLQLTKVKLLKLLKPIQIPTDNPKTINNNDKNKYFLFDEKKDEMLSFM
jgi:hypothetical protein